MQYGNIIAECWHLTVENPKFKWLVFVPSFVAVLVFMLQISWQTYMYLAQLEVIESLVSFENIGNFLSFLSVHNLWGVSVFVMILAAIFVVVIPPWLSSTLILGLKQKMEHPESYISARQKMIEGSSFFFRIFEFNAITGIFSLVSIALFSGTIFRFFNEGLFQIIFPFILGYGVFAFFINTFLSFAPYYIVMDDEGVIASMKKSAGLVFLNFGVTLAIMLLMFLVNFRIVVNVLVVMGVPLLAAAALTTFSNAFVFIISVFIGVALLALTAYLTALVEVFSNAVWIRAFQQLKRKQDSLAQTNGVKNKVEA